MRRWLPLLLAILTLTACSHPTGQLTVGVVYSGGSAPGVLAHRLQPGVVRVFREDGTVATSRHLAEGESLRTQLPPGRYRIEATSGDANCAPVSVDISVDGRQVQVVCSIK
jgi:hypothetical protein